MPMLDRWDEVVIGEVEPSTVFLRIDEDNTFHLVLAQPGWTGLQDLQRIYPDARVVLPRDEVMALIKRARRAPCVEREARDGLPLTRFVFALFDAKGEESGGTVVAKCSSFQDALDLIAIHFPKNTCDALYTVESLVDFINTANAISRGECLHLIEADHRTEKEKTSQVGRSIAKALVGEEAR